MTTQSPTASDRPSLRGLPLDAVDQTMSEPWLFPTPGFEQRVLVAAGVPLAQHSMPLAAQRREPWGWLGDWLLVATGLGGLSQAASLATAAWFTTVAGG